MGTAGSLAAECQGIGVRRLGRNELRELALLYRQVANDLSVVRQDGDGAVHGPYAESVAGPNTQYHLLQPQTELSGVLTFLRKDYPRHFRRLLPYTLTAIALFAAGGLLGTLLTLARHGFMESILGPAMVADNSPSPDVDALHRRHEATGEPVAS